MEKEKYMLHYDNRNFRRTPGSMKERKKNLFVKYNPVCKLRIDYVIIKLAQKFNLPHIITDDLRIDRMFYHELSF